jgi:hypothetical protein
MGLLDSLLGGSGPDLKVVELDPGTQALINQQSKNAQAGPGAIADKMNAGVREAGNQAQATPDQTQSRAAQTGEDTAGLQAIRNQYMKTAGDAVGGIVRQNQANAAVQQGQLLNQAARSRLAQQQVATQNYEMMTQAMNAADQARAQVLSNVLGVGGMAAGMYAAGPAGAKKPYKANLQASDYEHSTPTGPSGMNENWMNS